MTTKPDHIKGETERRKVSELIQFPGNANKGDLEAIKFSLEHFGQTQTIVVQRSTNYIIGGNHTVKAAGELGWEEIDAYVVDLDDVLASKLNVALNKLPSMAEFDLDLLAAQLESFDDLIGSGFTDDELEDLLVEIEEAAPIAPISDEPAPAPAGEREDRDVEYGEPDNSVSSDRREKFDPNAQRRDASRRLMVMDLPVPVFLWASDRLEELAKERDIQTNTEVILALIAEATGTEAPALTDEGEEAA